MKIKSILACLIFLFSIQSEFVRASIDQSTIQARVGSLMNAAKPGSLDLVKLAMSKANHPLVKQYAQKLVTDYLSKAGGIGAMAGKLGLGSDSAITKLSGAAFDKAFMREQVDTQQKVLDSLTKVLIPNAEESSTKTLLNGAKDKVLANLTEAKKIQSQL